ncbi:MAG TPA: DNA internalization-related competence protein ComEC/Rec2 [Burkholderiales bacterium]|nr:DNA internalization-related competence protein ComEC/Rec2 [Burkholderiales bacterium]
MRLNVIAFALGVWWLQQQAQLPALGWYWLLAPAVFAALALLRPRAVSLPVALRVSRRLALCLLAAVCGFGWAAWRAQERLADELPAAWEGRDIAVVGVVASLPQPYERSMRFDFDVEQVLTPQARVPAHIALSWWSSAHGDAAGELPSLHAGERWRFTVRLRRPHGTLNPNGFDYEAWLLERGVRATGYVREKEEHARIAGLVARPAYLIEYARETLRQRILAALPGAPYAGAGNEYAGVLAALAIGDQRAILSPQWQVFTRTGVNHLMSISGLHVTMISGLIFALVSLLWRRSEWLVLRLPAQKAAAAAGLAAAALYALLAGFEVPAQRTVYMIAVIAFALWSGAVVPASVVLAAALFAVLVIDPWAVNAAGFWLSFGAVALIFYVSTGRIAQPNWTAAWLRVQWAITVGLVPLTIALFQQVSIVSPLANAVAIPVVSLLVVPLTLIGMLLPFDLVLKLAHLIMSWCGVFLGWLSALPAAVWQQHAPPAWAVVAAMAGALWLLLPRGFPARWIGVFGFLPLFLTAPPSLPEGALKITVLDVGQGLAVAAQTSRHALLFDTGPGFGPGYDSGNRIIAPFLRATGVRALDAMVVSHRDNDHSGGAASVLQAMPVAMVFTSVPPDFPAVAGAQHLERCQAGQQWEWDGVRFEMLHPSGADYALPKLKENDRGCVLKIAAPGGTLLLPADIEAKSEREILEQYGTRIASDVLVAPHHGSRTSSTPAFIATVHPHVVVFTVGYRNRFGHPKEEVVQRYAQTGSRIYRSDRDGAVIVDIAAGRPVVRSWRDAYRRYWLEAPDLTSVAAEAD